MEANAFIVNELLDGKSNYEKWSIQVKNYLSGRDLWDAVDPDVKTPPRMDGTREKRKNSAALHAILISCKTEPFCVIKNLSSARDAWAALQAEYGQKPAEEEVERPEIESQIESKTEIQTELLFCRPTSEGAGGEGKPIEPNKIGDIPPNWALFRAVYRGDWDTAQLLLDQNPEAIRATIPQSGRNVLHVAVSEGHLHIVEKLVERMTDDEIEMRRVDGFSPIAIAIEIGSLPIAKCLITRHRKLAALFTPQGLPVRYAIVCGRQEMAPYLYSVTPIEDLIWLDGGVHSANLIRECIIVKLYDIALDLLDRAPRLAIANDRPGESPVWALAFVKELAITKPSLITFWKRWIYDCIHIPSIPSQVRSQISVDIRNVDDNQRDKEDINIVDKALDSFCVVGKLRSGLLRRLVSIPLQLLGIKNIYELKLVHVQAREILRRMCQVIEATSDRNQFIKAGMSNAMIQAAYQGNSEFITSIAKANPQLIWGNYIARRVFEVAIELRQPKIFSLIYGLRDKVALASYLDDKGSNMLHKVAIIANPVTLNRIPGAALQMQRELQWFKEIETIVSPLATMVTTEDHLGSTKEVERRLTAHKTFTTSHKDLVIVGEKWMKDTSSSCTVVGALIITVTFAAAFTFPGGNEQTRGYPMFIDKKLFRVFTISNAIALSASTTSVLMFLGILTSRYGEEDFLTSLPKKLIIGLSTLFFSIAAMLTAFCVGLSLMFHQQTWIVLPSVLLASIPVVLFAAIQFPLLVDIFMSTYGPSIFNKKTERWI